MPNPLTIVGTVSSVDAAPGPDQLTPVRFKLPNLTVYLPVRHPFFELYRRLLERLAELAQPVYVEIAPDADPGRPTISQIRIPTVTSVIGIEPDVRPGHVHVRLDNSSARHVTSTTAREDVEKMALLSAAL